MNGSYRIQSGTKTGRSQSRSRKAKWPGNHLNNSNFRRVSAAVTYSGKGRVGGEQRIRPAART